MPLNWSELGVNITMFFSKKYIIDKILAKKYALEMYLYSHPLFVKGIVVLIVGIGERWLLQLYGGAEQQGFYSFCLYIYIF